MKEQQYMSLAMNTLAARRQNSATDWQKRHAAVLEKLPEYERLEAETTAAGIRLAQTGADDGALQRLASQKEALLEKSGFGAAYLEPRFTCPKCKDTGRLNGALCSCVTDLIRKYRREAINSASPLSLSTFDTFQLSYYSTEEDPVHHLVPHAHMTAVLEFCTAYAAHFGPESPSLLMMGAAGLGKTHLALAIAGRALDAGADVLYVSAQSAFSQIENEKFSDREDGFLQALLSAELLILDDLGTEFLSPFVLAELYDLVNTRMLRRLPTIYTTNLNSQKAIAARYTEKISSRLFGGCTLLHFFGPDIRMEKNR